MFEFIAGLWFGGLVGYEHTEYNGKHYYMAYHG